MLELTDNAKTVLQSRYLREGEDPEALFRRVATAIGRVSKKWGDHDATGEFYDLLTSLKFLPNTPTLANAGTPGGQLSACFVLPVPDTMVGIFDTAKHMALIQKSGGGTGFAFSNLRANGSKVGEYGGSACGPLPFMEVYDQISATVRQGGMRHGANMGILRVDHPDILDFIRMKRGGKKLTNFNISVGATDEFMASVKQDGTLFLTDHNGEMVGDLPARQVFDEIVNLAWECGDPGLVFLDRINEGRSNPVPGLGPIQATNPCGEQPLYPYDSCNLGSIDLSRHFAQDMVMGKGGIDWVDLRRTVALAVTFLDNVIEANNYPLPEIQEMSRGIRRIGLGVMGWADLLYKMQIPYNSEEAVRLAEKVMLFVQTEADTASRLLGKTRGVFPRWCDSVYYADDKEYRNSTRTTIAPTGTISILAGCSSGIEPVFALAFRRQHKLDKSDTNRNVEMFEVNPVFERAAKQQGIWSADLVERLSRGESLRNFPGVPDWMARVFVTAHEIDPIDHLKMQAAFQRHTDNAVSKTINFRKDATKEDIRQAYLSAWDMDLKGITVYRDGSRDGQVLSTHTISDSKPTTMETGDLAKMLGYLNEKLAVSGRKKLEKTRQAVTHKFRVGEHNGYLTVGLYPDGAPGELFIKLNRQGHGLSGFADGTCMAVSIGLQYGVPLEVFVKKFKNTKFEPSGMTDDPDIRHCTSILDYVFRWMELRYLAAPVAEDEPGEPCPCGGYFVYEEGCLKCHSCGDSQC